MTASNEARFQGMVTAKLQAIEDRVEELIEIVHAIEGRCRAEQTASATLAAEVRELREKTNFHMRVIWSAVAWIVVAAAGMLLAALGVGR